MACMLFSRELVCHSLEGRRIDLVTITSWEGVSEEKEPRLPHLFPDVTSERCNSFKNKKVWQNEEYNEVAIVNYSTRCKSLVLLNSSISIKQHEHRVLSTGV